MTDRDDRSPAPEEGGDLSALYSRVAGAEPPRDLDAAVLRAARQAGEARQRRKHTAPVRRWPAPVGMAALLLLSGTLYLVLPPALREIGPPATDVAYAPGMPAPVVRAPQSDPLDRVAARERAAAADEPMAPALVGQTVAPAPVASVAESRLQGGDGGSLASFNPDEGAAAPGKVAGRIEAAGATTVFAGGNFARIVSVVDGEVDGFGVALARRLAEGAGIEPEFRVMPWKRALEGARQGWVPVLVGAYYTAERDVFLDYSTEPFAHDRIVLYARRDAPPDWSGDPAQLDSNLRVGRIPAWSYGNALDQWLAARPRHTARRLDLLLGMLIEGRLDIVPAPERNMAPLLANLEAPEGVVALDPPVHGPGLYFAFSRAAGMDWLRVHFDRRFRELRKDGGLAELRARYGLDEPG